jgi:DNA-binding MarR family transcriptional regulator
MQFPQSTLGTLLRRLLAQLDDAVEESYARDGLDYRPRYTPIIRALAAGGPATIRDLAARTGVSHSAASQTVAQLADRGLVSLQAGEDARERIVALGAAAEALMPRLERRWAATEAAARSLDDDLGVSLEEVLARALAALERQPFADRIGA